MEFNVPHVYVNGRSFEISSTETVFEGVARQNYELPRGCLLGTCGRCCVKVVDGLFNFLPPTKLELNTIRRTLVNEATDDLVSFRLTCKAMINGDISIETMTDYD